MGSNIEVKQNEFRTVQARLNEVIIEHHRISDGISRKSHEQRMASLTIKELLALPNSSGVYRSFGKAFIKSDMKLVLERLENVEKTAETEKERLSTRRDQLETSIEKLDSQKRALLEELQQSK